MANEVRTMTKTDRFVTQTTSGRWILTVIAGISFLIFSIATAYCVIKRRNDIDTGALITMVMSLLLVVQSVYKDFFHKPNDTENTGAATGEPK